MIRYALTIFLSAFLLFQVQPLFGKFILPWFGGTPAVWTTCMLFFQVLLLGGYAYAHFSNTRLTPRQQGTVHIVLLLVALAFLPIIPSPTWKPTGMESPTWRILGVLAFTIGVPYLILSSTAPLVQAWFSRDLPGRSPYRLYALSNFGSLLGLVSYPFIVEPLLSLRTQGWVWSVMFVTFVVACGWCAWKMRGRTVSQIAADTQQQLGETPERPRLFDRALWVLLPMAGSVMLLATTNQMSQDVAAVPFLWVLPLSLYLLSFIITFDSPRWYWRPGWAVALPLCVAGGFMSIVIGTSLGLTMQVTLYSAALLACCIVLHGELARIKPAPRYLTGFFLMMSAGGALGGFLVSIVAPALLSGFYEYPVTLMGTCFLLALVLYRQTYRAAPAAVATAHLLTLVLLVACGVLLTRRFGGAVLQPINDWARNGLPGDFVEHTTWDYYLVKQQVWTVLEHAWQMMALLAMALVLPAMIVRQRAVRGGGVTISEVIVAAVVIVALMLAAAIAIGSMLPFAGTLVKVVVATTTAVRVGLVAGVAIYFVRRASRPGSDWATVTGAGVVAVLTGMVVMSLLASYQAKDTIDASRNFYGVLRVDQTFGYEPDTRTLMHGRITHGIQRLDEDGSRTPCTYYSDDSGVGIAVRALRELKGSDSQGLRMGVVGLGTGTMAAWGNEGDYIRFYEINADVVVLNDKHFTYRKDSPAKIDIAMGDARITMERERDQKLSQQFDLLAVDAFSGDAVPLHLLTREAFANYFYQLKDNGVLAVHVSNLYLDLEPLVHDLAEDCGKTAVKIENDDDNERTIYSSTWILVTSNKALLESALVKEHTTDWPDRGDEAKFLFTDDYSNLYRILR